MKDIKKYSQKDNIPFIKQIKDKDILVQMLFESNPNMVFVKNEKLEFILCNEATLKFYGLESKEQIIGKTTRQIIKPLNIDFDGIDKVDRCVLDNNSKITFEEESYDFLNVRHFFKTTKICFIDSESDEKYLLVISNDITEDKEREQLFRQSHEFFTSLLDAIPASIFLMKEDAKYIYINKQARDNFNINSQCYIGKSCIEIFDDKDAALKMYQDSLEAIIAGNSKELTEVISVDGEERRLATIKLPFDIAGKKYLIAMKFADFDKAIQDFHDVLLTDMEKQMFFSMNTFISGITHEFRTPLQSIKGGLELLVAKSNNSNGKDFEIIKVMLSAVDNIVSIVNNLMHFGLRKGHYQDGEDIYKTIIQDRKKVNLEQLITETVEVLKLATLYKEHMQNGDINIIGDSDIECWVSNYILRNILINLINNSIKAIAVRANMEEDSIDKIINIRYYKDQEGIIIEVEDNGVGIKRELATKLFSPFFRVNREIPGIGIGLFISKFWATSAVMSLDLKESQYGKTVFVIRFKKQVEEF